MKVKPDTLSLVVNLKIPPGCGPRDVIDYVNDAVRTWAGSLDPLNDPLFDLDRDSVMVRQLRFDFEGRALLVKKKTRKKRR